MNYILDNTLTWIGNNKLATFFGVCLFCFIITTIVISSQKSSLTDKLAECEKSKKPKDDKDPPKDDKDKTSTTVKPPKGDGGEDSIPPVDKPKPSSFMSNDEETVWNNAEDSTYKRIHKRFVPMVAIA